MINNNHTLYLIPGLLTDKTLYVKLSSELQVKTKVLEFISANKNENIESYAKRLSEEIDQTKPFSILGTSFGGILAQEISKITNPEKVIIVSSAKSKNELSRVMKWKFGANILKFTPYWLIKFVFIFGFFFSSKIVRSHRKLDKEVKKAVYKIDGRFEKWAMQQFSKWKGNFKIKQLLHIHGDKDKVFSVKNIKKAKIINNGTHAMIVNKYIEISKVIMSFLNQ